jgi:RecA/RadA recombinase
MIIEIFGPPAAGKTTFARELAERLRRAGRPVELMLSSRPAERVGPGGDAVAKAAPLAALRRVARPAFDLLTRARPAPGSPKTHLASQLLELLPPASLIWSVRLRQYIRRLEISWRQAAQSDAIVIIDQGFVQAVCSLLLLGPPPAPGSLQKAVALIPRADQWVHIDAPRSILRTRLEARRLGQGMLERQLELDVDTALRTIDALDLLLPMLLQGNANIVRLGPGDSWTPGDLPGVAATRDATTRAGGDGTRPLRPMS